MEASTTDKLVTIWNKIVVGNEEQIPAGQENIQDYLYKLLISRNTEIFSGLNIDTTNFTKPDLTTLENIVQAFHKIEPHPLGFFPQGILLTKKLTCAGSAMLVNSILKMAGFEAYYLRPVSHSVNVVKLLDEYYWVDGANGVLDKIALSIENRGDLKIAHIRSTNARIPYTLAGFFESGDIIVNIFGNLQALKTRKAEDDVTIDFLKQNPELYDLDFNDFLGLFYKQYFDYIRHDTDYKKELERITGWIES